jgi:hypothetical protein
MKNSWILLLALALGGCVSENPRVVTRLNDSAALAGDLPFNPLRDKVITSWIDKAGSTMSTLYGNDAAIVYARANASHDYLGGTVLSVITWTQQEDPRWFGGNIPQKVKSVEFVTVGTGADHQPTYSYEEYEGAPLKKTSAQAGPTPSDRTTFLLSQRAAVMP